ncbi:hypothetical protein [Primorskyibacter sp. S87]|uniref:hypothetical protein n=1 Tax=Primorskyibacter sp. S87 TaxID=3415126 RepID=UPI003C7BB1C4
MRLAADSRGGTPGVVHTGSPRLMCVATHHKAGTVWIKRVMRGIANALDLPMVGLWSDRHLPKVPATDRAILVNWEGNFPEQIWVREDVVFLHLIRDPRDILLSGCAYHHTAPVKGERFLHEPRSDLGGLTYQQHLNALETRDEKLLFEMDNKHAETVQQMLDWPWGDQRVAELRYEDLIRDTSCELAVKAFRRLGLDGQELQTATQIFRDNSLFGGLADSSNRTGRLNDHIASYGKIKRWQTELPRAVGAVYADRFGEALIRLGYEHDIDWVKTLPEEVSE